MKNQYEPLVTPSAWTGDEKRFAVRLTQILDELYEKVGTVRKSDGRKLNADRIANTLDVEDEGYVLDARQGKELAGRIDRAASMIYPVGSLYLSVAEVDPAELFGGVWERLKDVFLLAAGDTYAVGETGGEAEVTLTVEQMPAHTHDGIQYYGNNGAISLNSGSNGYQLEWVSGTGYGQSDILTASAGGDTAHNNMPPYMAVYVWKRVE